MSDDIRPMPYRALKLKAESMCKQHMLTLAQLTATKELTLALRRPISVHLQAYDLIDGPSTKTVQLRTVTAYVGRLEGHYQEGATTRFDLFQVSVFEQLWVLEQTLLAAYELQPDSSAYISFGISVGEIPVLLHPSCLPPHSGVDLRALATVLQDEGYVVSSAETAATCNFKLLPKYIQDCALDRACILSTTNIG